MVIKDEVFVELSLLKILKIDGLFNVIFGKGFVNFIYF